MVLDSFWMVFGWVFGWFLDGCLGRRNSMSSWKGLAVGANINIYILTLCRMRESQKTPLLQPNRCCHLIAWATTARACHGIVQLCGWQTLKTPNISNANLSSQYAMPLRCLWNILQASLKPEILSRFKKHQKKSCIPWWVCQGFPIFSISWKAHRWSWSTSALGQQQLALLPRPCQAKSEVQRCRCKHSCNKHRQQARDVTREGVLFQFPKMFPIWFPWQHSSPPQT